MLQYSVEFQIRIESTCTAGNASTQRTAPGASAVMWQQSAWISHLEQIARGQLIRMEHRVDATGPLRRRGILGSNCRPSQQPLRHAGRSTRSEEHTSELQSLMRISYAVFCLKKKQYT